MKQHITYKTSLLLLLLLGVVGCETVVEFRGEYMEPVAVLNSVVAPDEPVRVFYSSSVFILSDNASASTHIDDATVELYINGTFVEQLAPAADTDQWGSNQRYYYMSSTCPKPYDQVTIRARSAEFPEWASATAIIPSDASVGNLQVVQEEVDDDGYIYGSAQVELSDAEGAKNYYWVLGHILTRQSVEESFVAHPYRHIFDYTDLAFSEGKTEGMLGDLLGSSSGENYALFDDTLIEGQKRYSLTMDWDIYQNYVAYDALFEVQCYQMDKHLYKYLRSLALADSESLFNEPVQIYSNVVGGIGIVGARSRIKTMQCLYSEIDK